ncbi:MAG TPA: hypothetical protein PLN38_17400, partial [Chitinophagales bacterium]|nr:hypothetical protein [Chitinophagales bacterium]
MPWKSHTNNTEIVVNYLNNQLMRKTLLLTFICGLLIAFGTSFTFKQSEKKFLKKRGFEFVPSGT